MPVSSQPRVKHRQGISDALVSSEVFMGKITKVIVAVNQTRLI